MTCHELSSQSGKHDLLAMEKTLHKSNVVSRQLRQEEQKEDSLAMKKTFTSNVLSCQLKDKKEDKPRKKTYLAM